MQRVRSWGQGLRQHTLDWLSQLLCSIRCWSSVSSTLWRCTCIAASEVGQSGSAMRDSRTIWSCTPTLLSALLVLCCSGPCWSCRWPSCSAPVCRVPGRACAISVSTAYCRWSRSASRSLRLLLSSTGGGIRLTNKPLEPASAAAALAAQGQRRWAGSSLSTVCTRCRRSENLGPRLLCDSTQPALMLRSAPSRGA